MNNLFGRKSVQPYKFTGVNWDCRDTWCIKSYQGDQTEEFIGHNRHRKCVTPPPGCIKKKYLALQYLLPTLICHSLPFACLQEPIGKHLLPVLGISALPSSCLWHDLRIQHVPLHLFLFIDPTRLFHLHSGTQIYKSSETCSSWQFQKVSHLSKSPFASLLVSKLWLLRIPWNPLCI